MASVRIRGGAVTGRLAAVLVMAALAGPASAEIALQGGDDFGLTLAEPRRDPVADPAGDARPSFQQAPGTGIVLRGSGRFGLLYEDGGGAAADVSVNSRLRVDVDVSRQTDGGVTFGGRIRAQASTGEPTGLAPAKIYMNWN